MTLVRVVGSATFLYVIIAAVLSGIFVWNSNRSSLPIILDTMQVIAPLTEVTPKVETASQISPDGTSKLAMKVKHNADNTFSYEFTTQSGSGSKKLIYSTTVDSKLFSVPFNAWSPNNKYFFIYKGGSNNALVFRADGQPISENEQFIDLSEVFSAKYGNIAIKEVTGWADPFLVVFNKEDRDGKKASYWLEVPSKAIIPLATNFYD